jgi:hypothetical protein
MRACSAAVGLRSSMPPVPSSKRPPLMPKLRQRTECLANEKIERVHNLALYVLLGKAGAAGRLETVLAGRCALFRGRGPIEVFAEGSKRDVECLARHIQMRDEPCLFFYTRQNSMPCEMGFESFDDFCRYGDVYDIRLRRLDNQTE